LLAGVSLTPNGDRASSTLSCLLLLFGFPLLLLSLSTFRLVLFRLGAWLWLEGFLGSHVLLQDKQQGVPAAPNSLLHHKGLQNSDGKDSDQKGFNNSRGTANRLLAAGLQLE
jgi:hypothetical protein